MLGKRSRPIRTNPSKSGAMSDLAEKRSIKLPLFLTFTEPDVPKSPTSPLDFKISSNLAKSPRGGWEKRDSEGIGLGIVAALNKTSDTHDAFYSPKASGAAITAGSLKTPPISPRSQPIPIVSAQNIAKSRGPKLENNKIVELSESYTCVINHHGPTSIKKFEYFDTDSKEKWRNSDVFVASPPEFTEIPVKNVIFEPAKFLSSCYLCRKKLHGRDIFMYRGDKAFCSVECRCQQILSDEHKERCGSVALKAFDYSVSPCSAPRLFSAGVAVA